jgi:phage gpG-like protein
MSATVTGLDEVYLKLGKLTANHLLKNALVDVGDLVLKLADKKVPVAEGILKSSGTVIKQDRDVLVGYNQEYAAFQHQGVRKNGSRIIRNRPGGGESFFLTSTIEENKDALNEAIKIQIAEEIKKLF